MNIVPDDPSKRWSDTPTTHARRSAYFLCAELVGVDDRLSHLGADRTQAFLAPYLTSLQQRLEANGATWIDVREWAVHAAFQESAQDAVGAAEEIQQLIAELTSDDRTFPVSLRIGLAVSEVWLDEGAMLWTERPVALAAALCGTARAGQILTTGAFLELVSDRQLDLRVAGRFDSPLLPVPIQTVEVLWSDNEEQRVGWPAALPSTLSSVSERTNVDNYCAERLGRAWSRCESQGAVSHRQLLGGTPEQRLDTVAALAADAHRSGAVVVYAGLGPESSDPVVALARSFRLWAVGQPADTLERVLGDELQRVMDWIPELRERLPIHPRLVVPISDVDVLAHLVLGVALSGPILWVIDGTAEQIGGVSEILAELGDRLALANATALLVELSDGQNVGQPTSINTIRLRSYSAPDSAASSRSLESDGHWRGLVEYREQDSDLYFGREALVAELLGFVERSRAVALVGDQWSGKSSLLAAGLIPALRSGALRGSEKWTLLTIRPGADPFVSLKTAIEHHPDIEGDDLSAALAGAAGHDGYLLLVIDQFEELFSQTERRDRETFLDFLSGLVAEADGRIRLLVATNTESYGACAEHRILGPSFERNLLLLRSPGAQDLEDIVRSPARVGGFTVDDEVVSKVVSAGANRADALPLISHLLRSLEQRRAGGTITASLYRSIGGLDDAIEHCAEEMYASADDQAVLRSALLAFLDPAGGGHLEFISRSAAELTDHQNATLEPFVEAGLICRTDDQLSLAGGLLITRWPRALSWFDTERQRIRVVQEIEEACGVWEAESRHPSLLFSGLDLRLATRSWMDSDADLSPLARSFLEESWDAETVRQERHLLRIATLERRQTAMFCVLALATVLVALVILVIN